MTVGLLRALELETQLNGSLGKRLRGKRMIFSRIRQLLQRIFRRVVPRAEPWMYGRVRDPEKDLAWTLEQNEKLRQALGARGE
jgi:hypothetical protein